jgi:hypothetical protein
MSVNTRCKVILGVALVAYLTVLIPNLPGAVDAVAAVLGLR